MKIDIFNHSSNGIRGDTRGGVFILVLVMTSFLAGLFWFAASRQQMIIREQEGMISYQEKQAFLDSFIKYLKNNSASLAEAESARFRGITYTLTRQTEKIDGFLESGQSSPAYNFLAPINVTIEWNKCVSTGEQGAVAINADSIETTVDENVANNCIGNPSSVFDDSHDISNVQNLVLTSSDAPISYRVTSQNGTSLTDTKWHFEYKMPVDNYGDIIVGTEFIE